MNLVIILLMIGALVTVFVGLAVMMKGGATDRKYSNKLMSLRVAFQAVAIALLFVVAYFAKH